MHITLSRKWWYLPFIAVILTAVGGMLTARLRPVSPIPTTGQTTTSDETTEIEHVAQQVATAFGQDRLYQSPAEYPLTDALKASIAKLPNRGQTWPEFAGLVGDAVVVLRGHDSHQRSFTDVVVHVLNRGVDQVPQLTQIDLRLIQDGTTWKIDHLLTLAKGAFQP